MVTFFDAPPRAPRPERPAAPPPMFLGLGPAPRRVLAVIVHVEGHEPVAWSPPSERAVHEISRALRGLWEDAAHADFSRAAFSVEAQGALDSTIAPIEPAEEPAARRARKVTP